MNNTEKKKKIIQKLNELQIEILTLGWNGILEKYHPENNIENPDAENIFKLYKQVFENMKKRVSIPADLV